LVTTADERSWSKGRKILFLGEWCFKNTKKSVCLKSDSLVCKPYGLGKNQYLDDISEKSDLYDRILRELSRYLNHTHKTSHSERYWNIIIGHWLNSHLMVIMNRYKSLEEALKNHGVLSTVSLNDDNFNVTGYDYSEARDLISSDLWNNNIYIDILRNSPSFNIEIFEKRVGDNFKVRPCKKEMLSRRVKSIFFKIARALVRNNDAVICNSYLPSISEIKLYLSLFQVPQRYENPKLNKVQYEFSTRKSLTLNYEKYSGVEREIRRMIGKLMPICYLEGYMALCQQAIDAHYPKNPRFIFTSNNFRTDEIFKVWVAEQTNRGTKYFVGQHGADYGTHVDSTWYPEINTCDKFFSWGWREIYNNVDTVPAFNFRIVKSKQLKSDNSGGLIFVERGPGTRDGARDRYFEEILVHKNAINFYRILPSFIQDKVVIRPHIGVLKHGSFEIQDWNDNFPNIKINVNNMDLDKLVEGGRLVVFNYDSTGVLEYLSQNFPVVCFWNYGFDYMLPSARPYYQLLKDVGIYFDTPEAAALHISLHWHDINGWWNSASVQEARIRFCNEYSRTVHNPVSHLKNLLISNIQ
jgi:putative transferase (TIGR04331 family)